MPVKMPVKKELDLDEAENISGGTSASGSIKELTLEEWINQESSGGKENPHIIKPDELYEPHGPNLDTLS